MVPDCQHKMLCKEEQAALSLGREAAHNAVSQQFLPLISFFQAYQVSKLCSAGLALRYTCKTSSASQNFLDANAGIKMKTFFRLNNSLCRNG